MKLRSLGAALAVVLALPLSACNAGGGTQAAGGQAKDSLIVAQTAEPANLDYTTTGGAAIPQALLENVYQSLVRVDQDGKIQPSLAKAWKVSEDGKTYTFDLQTGVKFASGADFTAEDVKYSYDRVRTGKGWKNPLSQKMAIIDSVTADGDAKVTIKLKQRSNSWLYNLASLVGTVFDSKDHDDLANKANGTGPFAIEKFTRGQDIVFAARDDYWADKPKLKQVTFKYFKDGVSAANALKSGQVDVLSNLQAPDLLSDFQQQSDKFEVIEGTTNGEVVLSMNNAAGIFKDKKARQAVMYAIDRKAVMDTAWGGHGTLIGSMVPPTDPYYEDLNNVYPYDVDKAKKLVDEAGISGKSLTFTVPNLPYATAISNIVVSQLKAVGLNAKVQIQEFPGVWIQKTLTDHSYDMSVVSHVEARDILTVFGKGYYTGYDYKRIEADAAKADAGTEQEYIDGMKKVARTITDDAAADFLFLLPNLIVANKGVTGLPKNQITDAFRLVDLAAA
ncbi:ABC transporter substrate-binding protein [Brevibacterium sp. 91QC2O2]|uniref:ABC transporter substrate-binding protein n=1 Tax=Brevibacterium sp. 91QC2O2 TaxID=2968458 RepID=UPI00211CB094|nr:ABC transporter substrate-binding protein [Brevibacterium sp. 91QC2O2]MCQ9369229.1 ABC transporter substrate-binding protein [Brevibacterium sp. 91QC2O2]